MRKKQAGALLLCISLVFVGGCWDSKELNDQALQVGTGIDLNEEGEFVLSNQFSLNSSGPSSEGNSQQESYTEMTKGDNVFKASAAMQARITRKINRGQRTSIAIGEKLAREGLKQIIDIYTRTPEAQLRNDLFIVKGGFAADLLNSSTPFGSLSQREYFKLHQAQKEVADVTLMNMLRSVNGDSQSGAIVPAMERVQAPISGEQKQKKQNKYAYTGVAVINNDLKLVGFLNNEETAKALWLLKRPHIQYASTYIPEGSGLVTAKLSSLKCKIKAGFGENTELHIAMKANAELMENGTNLDLLSVANLKLIEQALELHTRKQFTELIHKVQSEYKTDIFNFGDTIFRYYPSQWRRLQNRWESEFPKAAVTVKVDIKVKRVGLTGGPVQLKEGELEH